MIEIYFKTVRDPKFKKVKEWKPGSWIYVKHATIEDLTTIAKETGMELADLRDSLDKFELPRVEQVQDSVLFFVRHPGYQEAGVYTLTLTLVFTKNFVIAISPATSDIIEHLIQNNTPLGTTQKTKLLLYILLKITQDFTHNIKRVGQSLLGYETAIDVVDTNAIILLTKNEEILNHYHTALVPMTNVLASMSHGRYMSFHEADNRLLEDLLIAIRQSEDICRVNIKSIRSLRDSYHIIFTNNVNKTIKLLTGLTILFSIPTTVASIYGMNIPLPFQTAPYAFGVVMGITAVILVMTIAWFIKRQWL